MQISCLLFRVASIVGVGALAASFASYQAPASASPGGQEGAAAAAQETVAPTGTAEPGAESDLPPIPDPPRFISEIVGSVGDINGDLFWWGQSVSLTGSVLNNAFVGGSTASIDGTVGSDAFAFAGTTYVTGEVSQNVYAFTGQMFVQEGAVIHGNLMCFCGSLTINGTVRGQVLGSGGQTIVTGDVGSMKLEVGTLNVGPDAVVRGDLEYAGNETATVSPDADVRGEVRWNVGSADDEDDDADEDAESVSGSGFSFWDVASTLWWYLANLVVGVAFLVFGGRAARQPIERLREQAAVGLGFGFVVAVVVPVACLIALLMLVTLPLGFIVMQFYMLAMFLARLITAQYLGDWILRRAGQEQPSEYLALAGGLVVFFLATEIPYVGFLIWLTALFLGMGGIFLAARGKAPATAVTAPTH
jgi:cytoskeletal protein CcmA (bactofilin family)